MTTAMKPTDTINKPDAGDGSDDNDDLCKSRVLQLRRVLPKSKRTRILLASILFVLFTFNKTQRTVINKDFRRRDAKVYSGNSSRPTNFLMYVMTLQGVEGADGTNDGRYDQFQRHWKILCHADHDDPNILQPRQERINFHKCPGHLTPRGASGGYGLSMAFQDCFHWALKHHKQWHKDNNPTAKGLDDDSIPFVFLEDDARLYNPNFCDSEYRNRIWQSLPQTNATLLMLGGHSIHFYDKNHSIARAYQDHYYNETILMDPSVLPQFIRPRRGFGSYGFALLNTPTVEYMTRKMDKMLNRTFDFKGMKTFKAIDQQFHHYGTLKTFMSYPWLIYHEGGLYSNTKGEVRGEYGDGSKQYRWIAGLTGSAKNCTGSANKDFTSSELSKTRDLQHYEEGTAVVSCRTITFRIPGSFSLKNNSSSVAEKKILIAIVSRSNHSDLRASIRSTWGKLSQDKFFLVAGPWQEIVSEFEEHGDLVWVNLPENGSSNGNDDADASTTLSSLQVASFLTIAETLYGDHYSHILKVTDHSYANLGAIRSQLEDKDRRNIAMWGSHCGTGVRPSHIGVSKKEYSDYFFPQYCKGEGYALSQLFVRCAVAQIPQSRLISLDDAYIGILGERCGLQENQFHSGADVGKRKMPLLKHDIETSAAMEEYSAYRLNATFNSEHR